MNFIKKYLPIIFGCHCRNDRSFYWRGKKFPICARCTGELIGIFISLIMLRAYTTELVADIFLIVPLIIDGFLQLLTRYKSNNVKRLVTGILFGYGFLNIFIKSIVFVLHLGYNYGKLHNL